MSVPSLDSGAPNDAVGAGAPGNEIELTPAMIEAGIEAISGFDLLDAWDGYLDRGEFVAAIYHAMNRAR